MNWLENLRIISAPGFTKYKQNRYLFSVYISVCMYKANKGVAVVVVVVVVVVFLLSSVLAYINS